MDVTMIVYVVLAALAEGEAGIYNGVPNGHLYAAIMDKVSLDEWNKVLGVVKRVGWVTETGHLLKITDKGKASLAKMEAVLAEVRKPKE